MAVEESVHYPLVAPEAMSEWLETSPGTYGGNIRLGPDNRAFFVSMFHQLHCLRYFRTVLVGDDPVGPHLQHCFNLLRQWILCHADLTLEPGDFTERDFQRDRQGATHKCRDWEVAYDVVERDTVRWFKYRVENNMTGKPSRPHQ